MEKDNMKVKQCQVLDDYGHRCKNKAIKKLHYHGDPESYYNDNFHWVEIWVCKKHGEGLE